MAAVSASDSGGFDLNKVLAWLGLAKAVQIVAKFLTGQRVAWTELAMAAFGLWRFFTT